MECCTRYPVNTSSCPLSMATGMWTMISRLGCCKTRHRPSSSFSFSAARLKRAACCSQGLLSCSRVCAVAMDSPEFLRLDSVDALTDVRIQHRRANLQSICSRGSWAQGKRMVRLAFEVSPVLFPSGRGEPCQSFVLDEGFSVGLGDEQGLWLEAVLVSEGGELFPCGSGSSGRPRGGIRAGVQSRSDYVRPAPRGSLSRHAW